MSNSSKKVLLIDCGSKKTPLIAECISNCQAEVKIVKMFDSIDVLNDFDAIVISGAPILLTKVDASQYLNYFGFLKVYKGLVLGICFGHQILGMLSGAKIMSCIEDRTERNIKVWRDSLFSGFQNKVLFREDHCESITLPNNYELIATSENCLVEGMKSSNGMKYGVQFHPESSGENGKLFFKNFLNLIPQPS